MNKDSNAATDGASGTVTLTDVGGGKTDVKINLTEGTDTGMQQAHIHNGQCGSSLGSVAYPLTSLTGGTSDTTVAVEMEALKGGKYAINVHNSADPSKYVSCGNIP